MEAGEKSNVTLISSSTVSQETLILICAYDYLHVLCVISHINNCAMVVVMVVVMEVMVCVWGEGGEEGIPWRRHV